MQSKTDKHNKRTENNPMFVYSELELGMGVGSREYSQLGKI